MDFTVSKRQGAKLSGWQDAVAATDAQIAALQGQLATVPQVVASVVLDRQSGAIGSPASPVALFTPTQEGMYRWSAYVENYGDSTNGVTVHVVVNGGIVPSTEFGVGAGQGASGSGGLTLKAAANVPISYYVTVGGDGTLYNARIVLEALN